MKILTVVGARPQFVKASPLSRALAAAGHDEFVVHTGQHYDDAMSQVFFDELSATQPNVNLGVGSGKHGWQTARMLTGLEEILEAQRPDWVLVYGDTNSTLAAALAAVKLQIPLAHVEAGLRSFNRSMPEEHNRIVTDHCSDLLLCPTQTAMDHLAREGLAARAHLVGDVMLDAFLHTRPRADARSAGLLTTHALRSGAFCVATVHRPYNTDDPDVLRGILDALGQLAHPVLLPLHPRTRARLDALDGWTPSDSLSLIEPLGYLDLIGLAAASRLILTDSGGLQKEAYFLGVPCLTLRPETEWVETVNAGWNVLVGNDPARISAQAASFAPPTARPPLFGDGHAAEAIVELLACPRS